MEFTAGDYVGSAYWEAADEVLAALDELHPERVRDVDGDVWERLPSGQYVHVEWASGDPIGRVGRHARDSYADLEAEWGPLTPC